MEWDNEVILKSFKEQQQNCHERGEAPIRPINSQVKNAGSEIPIFLPHVEDEKLKPLLMA